MKIWVSIGVVPNPERRFTLESERLERQKSVDAFLDHYSPHCECHVERPAPFQDFQPGNAPIVEQPLPGVASLVLSLFFLHPYELVVMRAFGMSYSFACYENVFNTRLRYLS
jgi:hypothetical protein